MNIKKRTMKKFMSGCLLLIVAGQLSAQELNRVYEYDADGNRIERRQETATVSTVLSMHEVTIGTETITMETDHEKKVILFTRNRPTSENGKIILYNGQKVAKILPLTKEAVQLDVSSLKSEDLQIEIVIGEQTYKEKIIW